MNSVLRVQLQTSTSQAQRLDELQMAFAQVCNAIYSVSRACRLVYQHPSSPFNHQRLAGKALPRVHFLPQAPVYFDRHTLSLKDGQISMFTLDGRMRFKLALEPENERRFREEKLRRTVTYGNKKAHSLDPSTACGSATRERTRRTSFMFQ